MGGIVRGGGRANKIGRFESKEAGREAGNSPSPRLLPPARESHHPRIRRLLAEQRRFQAIDSREGAAQRLYSVYTNQGPARYFLASTKEMLRPVGELTRRILSVMPTGEAKSVAGLLAGVVTLFSPETAQAAVQAADAAGGNSAPMIAGAAFIGAIFGFWKQAPKKTPERAQLIALAQKSPEDFDSATLDQLLLRGTQGEQWIAEVIKPILRKEAANPHGPQILTHKLRLGITHRDFRIQQNAYNFLLNINDGATIPLLKQGLEAAREHLKEILTTELNYRENAYAAVEQKKPLEAMIELFNARLTHVFGLQYPEVSFAKDLTMGQKELIARAQKSPEAFDSSELDQLLFRGIQGERWIAQVIQPILRKEAANPQVPQVLTQKLRQAITSDDYRLQERTFEFLLEINDEAAGILLKKGLEAAHAYAEWGEHLEDLRSGYDSWQRRILARNHDNVFGVSSADPKEGKFAGYIARSQGALAPRAPFAEWRGWTVKSVKAAVVDHDYRVDRIKVLSPDRKTSRVLNLHYLLPHAGIPILDVKGLYKVNDKVDLFPHARYLLGGKI